jgi:hypothetical protein
VFLQPAIAMKIRPLLLALSFAVNVALIYALATGPSGWKIFSVRPSAIAQPNGPAAAARAPAPGDAPLDPQTWSTLASGDLAATIARFKAEGFPPAVQRAIASVLVIEQFRARHHALAGQIRALPWNGSNPFSTAAGAKVLSARQQLQRDEKAVLDQLVGAESGQSEYARLRDIGRYGELPAGKQSELDRINSDYNELMSEIRNATGGILLPEDREKMAYLEKEKRADIAQLLTPDELFEYDLRASSTASQLRYQLAAFEPTSDEFRAIFRLTQAFDARFGASLDLMTTEQRRQRGQAQPELNNQIKAALTPDRYTEYQQKTDSAYVLADSVVKRFQLPAATTAEVVAVQKDILKRSEAVRLDRNLNADQRVAQLTALGNEAAARLTQTLGDAALSAYRQGGGGWIGQLQRPPPPPSAAPSPKS